MPERHAEDQDAELEQVPGSERPGPRPVWSGTLSFGLVSIPVSLFSAQRRAPVSLRWIAEDGTPLARRYYCPNDDQEVEPEHLVRGYELPSGEHVVVSDEELEALDPKKSRDVDLRLFVPAASIDPMFFERAYVMAPGGESVKAYRLLCEVMQRKAHAGVATFVMREKEYLCAIFARDGLLHLETLRFADELRAPDDVGLPQAQEPEAAPVRRFEHVIDRLAHDELAAEELTDAPSLRLRELVEDKRRRGQDVVESAGATELHEQEQHGEVIDLMDVLKQSLGARVAPAARAAEAASDQDRPLESLSKQELYARAQALEIRGRSEMSKAQLVRALRKRDRAS